MEDESQWQTVVGKQIRVNIRHCKYIKIYLFKKTLTMNRENEISHSGSILLLLRDLFPSGVAYTSTHLSVVFNTR